MSTAQEKNMLAVLKFLVFLTVIAIGLMGVLAGRGLFADGSNFLLHILSSKDFYVFDKPRLHVQAITQFPLVLSIIAGMDSLNKLVLIHSASLIAPVLICWLMALIIHFRTKYFWPLVIAFSLSYLTSVFFTVGEYNLTYALAALCCAILLSSNLNFSGLVALLLASFALVRSYEAMAFLGPPLFFITLHIIQKKLDLSFSQKLCLSLAAFLFAAASTIAAWSILYPRDPVNLAGAAKAIYLTTTGHFIFVTSMLITYIALHARLMGFIKYFLVAVSISACIFYLFAPPLWNTPSEHYSFRSMSGGMLLGLLFMILAMHQVKAFELKDTCSSAVVAFALFLSLSIPLIDQTIQFYSWAKKFEQAALQAEHWIPSDEIQGLSDSKFYWSWSNPSLSAVVRGNYSAGILNKSTYRGWQPFDPLEVERSPLPYTKYSNFYH